MYIGEKAGMTNGRNAERQFLKFWPECRKAAMTKGRNAETVKYVILDLLFTGTNDNIKINTVYFVVQIIF